MRTIHAWLLVYVFRAWYVTFVPAEKQAPNVGARIKEAREQLGISQTALADRLDAGERTVQAWERNERIPRMGSMVALATALGRDVSWFYTDTEKETA